MSNESGAAESIPEMAESSVTAEQVAAFLSANPDFFLDHQELLADLTLPHQSGEAVSLLERQVSVVDMRLSDRVVFQLEPEAAELRAELVKDRLKAMKKVDRKL